MVVDPLKTELTAQLARSRSHFSRHLGQLKEDLDVPAHVKRSFMNHQTSWIGAAALLGWVISRLGKSEAPSHPQENTAPKLPPKKTSSLLPGLAKILFQAARPALTALAADKIVGFTSKRR